MPPATRKKSATPKVGKKSTPTTVDQYAATVPDAARGMFAELRAAIGSVVPSGATEVINYGIPAVADNGIVVWFAAFSDHCSLFPQASVIEAFRKGLEGFSTSKGTIHFPLNQPLPVGLVKRIVRARVKEKAVTKRK